MWRRRPTSLQSLRGRLACFFAALIAALLCLFAGVVYVAAEAMEAQESEPQAEKERELAQVRHLLYSSLAVGIPIAGSLAVLGSAWMTRRSLRALSEIVRLASQLDPERLGQRMPVSAGDDLEIQRLVAALNRMLSRVERAVSGLRRFTQDAAHELRTPLSALSSRLEIALRRPREVAALRLTLEESLEELAALQRLVEALLLLARSDAGELPVQLQTVALRPFLLEVVSLYEALASERELRLHVECAPGLSLYTDKLLLGRAVANLIDNACKFSPPGGEIVVRAQRQAGATQITIADAGPGIPAAVLPQVFERFYRGDSQRSGTGSGLGLALAREFVAALGGQVQLERRAGGGTLARIAFGALSPGEPDHTGSQDRRDP